jgi:anthranilate phosphoribosyltransferase
LLESLGVKVELGPQQVRRCIQEVGIGFFFAPLFHPAMKQVLPVRRQMGIRTVFNIIGPLTNPAFAKRQLLGVYNPGIAETLGQTLKELDSEKVFVVHGGMGEDEVSLCAPTKVVRLSDGKIDTFFFEPEQIRVKKCASIHELRGGTPEENAKIALSILKGERSARTDAVIVNAAFAIVAAGLCEDLIEAKERAEESIQSGKALEKLHTLQRFTNAIG